jgi:DnaJ-class molecular chaperone
MTIETYLTADMHAALCDAPMVVAVTSYGTNSPIIICPHCDGDGFLGYRQCSDGVVEDTCSACKGRGVLIDVNDDGIPF